MDKAKADGCLTVTGGFWAENGRFNDKQFNRAGKITRDGTNGSPSEIKIDWSTCADSNKTVKGVWIHTDEALTSANASGFDFFVGTEKCPDTNGLDNSSAKGGVFNCNITGSSFTLKLLGLGTTDIPDPYVEISEIQLWTDEIISIKGTPSIFTGNEVTTDSNYDDLTKVWGLGSYYSTVAHYYYQYRVHKSSATLAGIEYAFEDGQEF